MHWFAWPVSSFGKELASQLLGKSSIPRWLFPWARNLGLSSWANAATASGGPKIVTALCAIMCCITLLYRVRMPATHYASSAVIHMSWLCAPFRNKQTCNSEGNLHTQEENWFAGVAHKLWKCYSSISQIR